jgi:hypothetical protein
MSITFLRENTSKGEMREDTREERGSEVVQVRRGTESLISCFGYWREQDKISMRDYRRV